MFDFKISSTVNPGANYESRVNERTVAVLAPSNVDFLKFEPRRKLILTNFPAAPFQFNLTALQFKQPRCGRIAKVVAERRTLFS